MKKILMLLQSEFPPDIRLEKEIRTLSSNGFEVTLLCNQYDVNKNDEFPGCKIFRIKALTKNIAYNKIINFPLFLNPRIIYYLFKVYFRIKPDYVHAHDLPMVPLALFVKFIFNKRVIFDMHENYPEALKAFEKKGIINYLFKNYKFAKFLENFCVNRSDRIISVVEENNVRLEEMGISENKLAVVSNTVDLNTFNFETATKIDLSVYSEKFIVLYSGTVSPERDLLTAVKSIIHIKDKIPNLLMLIIGDGKSVFPIQNYIRKNKLGSFIEMIPWVGHDKIPFYISRANICIIPQPSNSFIDTTIPHKLFEYMSLSKTVLVSDAKPLKRIVEETNTGLVFNSKSSQNFAVKVLEIYNSNTNYGTNGRIAIENKYNWGEDSRKLITMYQNLT